MEPKNDGFQVSKFGISYSRGPPFSGGPCQTMGGQKLKKRKYVILGLLHNSKAKIIEVIDHIFLFGESQGNLIDQTSLYVLYKNHIDKKLSPGHAALKKMSNYVTIVLILCKKFFSETYI